MFWRSTVVMRGVIMRHSDVHELYYRHAHPRNKHAHVFCVPHGRAFLRLVTETKPPDECGSLGSVLVVVFIQLCIIREAGDVGLRKPIFRGIVIVSGISETRYACTRQIKTTGGSVCTASKFQVSVHLHQYRTLANMWTSARLNNERRGTCVKENGLGHQSWRQPNGKTPCCLPARRVCHLHHEISSQAITLIVR